MPMPAAEPQITIDGDRGATAEPNFPGVPSLPGHVRAPRLELHIGDTKSGELAEADAGVVEQQQDGGVPSVDELPPLCRLEQLLEVVLGDHRDRTLRDAWCLHAFHRRTLDLLLLERPAPELLQCPELERKRGGLHSLPT